MFRNIFAGRKKKSIIIVILIMLMVGVYTVYSYFENKETEEYLANYAKVSQALSDANTELIHYITLDKLHSESIDDIKEKLVQQKNAVDKITDTFVNTKVNTKYKQQHADTTELLHKESDLLDKVIMVVDKPMERKSLNLFTNINDDIYALKSLAKDSNIAHTAMPSFNDLDKIIEPMYVCIYCTKLTQALNESLRILAYDIRPENLYSDKVNTIKDNMIEQLIILDNGIERLIDADIKGDYKKQNSNIITFTRKDRDVLNKIIFALDEPRDVSHGEFLPQLHDDIKVIQDLTRDVSILGIKVPSFSAMDYSIKILGMYIKDKYSSSSESDFVYKWKKLKKQSYKGDTNILITGGGINYNTYIARDSVVVKENNEQFVVLGCKMMSETKNSANYKKSWSDEEFKYDLKNKDLYFTYHDGRPECDALARMFGKCFDYHDGRQICLTTGIVALSRSYDSCMRSAGEIAYYLAFGKNFRHFMDQSYLLLERE